MKKGKSSQPNFEKLKVIFFNAFRNTEAFEMQPVLETVITGKLTSYHRKYREMESDFNKWLDGLDIRQAGKLIKQLVEHGKSLPAWMKESKFIIDYNNNGCLDLIRKS